jgi:glycine reductase complex component B subunit gamma
VVKVVHYLNQFFAGLGGEEAAKTEPLRLVGPVGPGKGLGLEIGVTLACGDDYFGEHEEPALERLLAWLEEERPDVVVCGPSFGSGRYGYACGSLAREVARRGIPVVCGMHPESPGVLAAEGAAYIVPTEVKVAGMRDALPRMADLARRLAAREQLGPSQQEGYLPRGLRRNEIVELTGAERAVELLLAKLGGDVRTEVMATYDDVSPPPPVDDLPNAMLALVTEAGLVPKGNPDRLESNRAHIWLTYSIEGVDDFDPAEWETVHGGYDTTVANVDPDRLVPLDATRRLAAEGRIGSLHERLYTTTGNSTPVATSAKFGQDIAHRLRDEGVQAVILTGT